MCIHHRCVFDWFNETTIQKPGNRQTNTINYEFKIKNTLILTYIHTHINKYINSFTKETHMQGEKILHIIKTDLKTVLRCHQMRQTPLNSTYKPTKTGDDQDI